MIILIFYLSFMINDANALNEHKPNVSVRHSTFPQERHVLGTYRFGEYAPFFYFDGIPSDSVRQRSVTTTRSMSLSAPLMEDIKLKRDYFIVPYQALLPKNWEKVYVHPKKGDDVIATQVGPFVKGFVPKVYDVFLMLWDSAFSTADATWDRFLKIFQCLCFAELFFSNGCLLSTLGVHLSDVLAFRYYPRNDTRAHTYSLDRLIDVIITDLLSLPGVGANGATLFRYVLKPSSTDPGLVDDSFLVDDASSFRLFLNYLREGDVLKCTAPGGDTAEMLPALQSYLSDSSRLPSFQRALISELYSTSVDLARCAAYQICCAHYFTNDQIDYIYSAELWREYLGSTLFEFTSPQDFVYNGVSYLYDWLSAFYFDFICSSVVQFGSSFDTFYSYFATLFGFRRSLRFVDYFAGGRKEPLAVGDPNVAVNNDMVSVVEINRMTQFQRLWNNVLRIPSQIEGYVKGMFPGAAPKYDYHNPAWLAHTTDVVFAAEVENTGDSQVSLPNSVTATFRGSSNDKEFSIDIDFPGIIIGIQYFDIRRAYYSGIDRLVQHEDRYDMALPELQYIGDQDIRGSELVSWLGDSPISYTGRNMEYKQVIDQAFGGFVESLPGWAFLFKPEFWRVDNPSSLSAARISPNFIRSFSVELDPYFIQLSGFSLGTYFHFQQKIVNITEAKRPLVKDPQILG